MFVDIVFVVNGYVVYMYENWFVFVLFLVVVMMGKKGK